MSSIFQDLRYSARLLIKRPSRLGLSEKSEYERGKLLNATFRN